MLNCKEKYCTIKSGGDFMGKVHTCQLSTDFEKSNVTWEEYPPSADEA